MTWVHGTVLGCFDCGRQIGPCDAVSYYGVNYVSCGDCHHDHRKRCAEDSAEKEFLKGTKGQIMRLEMALAKEKDKVERLERVVATWKKHAAGLE